MTGKIKAKTTDNGGLWGVDDVAAYLKISSAHVYRLVQDNRIPFVRVSTCVRFSQRSIDAWVDDRTRKAVK